MASTSNGPWRLSNDGFTVLSPGLIVNGIERGDPWSLCVKFLAHRGNDVALDVDARRRFDEFEPGCRQPENARS
jgi:hypothetical protein